MTTYDLIIAPVLVALAALFVGLGAVLVRNTYPAGARAAGLAMAAIAIWLFGAAGEILTAGSPALFSLIVASKYLGVATVGPLYLVFVLQYALGWRASPRALMALFAIPAITVALAWTNPVHELMWVEPFPPLGRGTWGPWFNAIHTPYSYLAILAGTGGLVLEMVRGSTLRRAQSSLLVVGALVPLAVNAIYLANPQIPDLAQTPLSFSVTGLVFGWGFFRLRLFQVSPLALRAAFDAVGDPVVVVDLDRRIADLNEAGHRLLAGPGAEPPLGRTVSSVLTAAGIREVPLEEGSQGDRATPGGRRLDTEVRAIRDRRQGGVRGWIVVFTDVTDQRRAERALRESEGMMRSVLERSPIAILRLTPLHDESGRPRNFSVVLANPNAHDILVGPGEALVGRTLTEIRPPHTPLLMDTLRRLLRTGDPEERVVQVDERDGTHRWLRLNAVAVGDDVAVTFVDITAEREQQEALTSAAHSDPLTELLNRRGLEKDGAELIASARAEGRPLALLFVDLDDFKAVNDSFGHDAGDAALREFARRLQACLRAEDLLARVGGDEFVLLLQEPAPETLAQVVRRIDEACASPVLIENPSGNAIVQVHLRSSMGSAAMPEDGDDLPSLMRAADAAMYRAKAERVAHGG